MAASPSPSPGPSFRFRRLGKPEEFRQLEELDRLATGPGAPGVAPVSLQRAVQDNGGLVLGAFVDIHLVGASLSFLGWDGRRLYQYTHLLAVRPEYQNHRVAYRLQGYLREEAIAMGIDEVRWTIDPLQSKAARLSIRSLGAHPTSYYPHYFGRQDLPAPEGTETDRLLVVWPIQEPRVAERLGGTLPSGDDDRARWSGASAIVTTEPGESGIRIPTEVAEPTGPTAHLEIPFDLALVREHEPAALRTWRHAVRDAFRAAYDLGYVVDDFAVVRADHERRSFYLLRHPPPGGPGAPAGSGGGGPAPSR
ncbi:MAG: hypothetical protein QXG65_02575 [Thermoplasmata archaeon]